MRFLVIGLVFFLGAPVQAALIDNGSFTTDTVSDLDWLDLSLTDELGPAVALAANSGWRLPTNLEIEQLFSAAFAADSFTPGAADDLGGGAYYNSTGNPLAAEAHLWVSLFGVTDSHYGNETSWGVYQDESSACQLLGATAYTTYSQCGFGFCEILGGTVYTPDYDGVFRYGGQDPNGGVFLVRATVIPIPAAALMFISALATLGWQQRKYAV